MEYRNHCVKLTISIRKERIRMGRELVSKTKHDPKLIHKYIRNKMDVKEQIRAIKDDEVRLTVNRSEIADILSNHFESVFVKESSDPLPVFEARTEVSFGIERVLIKINEGEIIKRLKNLKESKSMGSDQIHPMILKECAMEFAIPLTKLFRESIKQGKFPNSWRFAKISPLFKKGHRTARANYRPISLT